MIAPTAKMIAVAIKSFRRPNRSASRPPTQGAHRRTNQHSAYDGLECESGKREIIPQEQLGARDDAGVVPEQETSERGSPRPRYTKARLVDCS